MSYRTYQKRTAALAFAAALAGSAVLMAAPAAVADVVDVNYQCKTPIGDKSAVSPIDIKSVKSGSGYKLTMSFQKGVSSSPVELGKGAMNPSAVIKLGGADSGSVAVSGPANPAAIPANTPIKINDLSGTYTPKKTGKVTFTAGVLTIKALGTTTTCTPGNNPKPSLTLDVTAGSGGGTSGSTQSDTDTGSGLPQTGPEDSAIALGTLGGTVLLAGAAGSLWLTRRNQAARR
ncbi:LPXTG cell wall anchor domain-containing protein [Streptomyces avermitilis]|uniref:LPXTG cell wall anchor domain-containing protein n=1 Tax=Streptomyces avermitilis TaxID=33903 RepID=UPI0033B6FB82